MASRWGCYDDDGLGRAQRPYVRCFVEDCGYTGVWDEFSKELKSSFGLPAFPLLYTASWLCDLKYGWNFREASSLAQVAKCRLPMLSFTAMPTIMSPPGWFGPLFGGEAGRQGAVARAGCRTCRFLPRQPGGIHAPRRGVRRKIYRARLKRARGGFRALLPVRSMPLLRYMKHTMENDNQQQVKSFYRILKEGIAKLPAGVRGVEMM